MHNGLGLGFAIPLSTPSYAFRLRGETMATTPQAVHEPHAGAPSELQDKARRHLWMHFTRMGAFDERHEVPIIVRGEGCYVYDQHGRRYLDGLSALYCVNIGHGRADVAQAGADHARELGFFTNWGYAHPKAIELAARIGSLAPGDLNRVFFPSGGSESVDSALKLCRQYHKLTGNPGRYKVISRKLAYHGTTMGALTATGIPDVRRPFEPLFPGSAHVANTNAYRPEVEDPAEAIRERIEFEGPETVSCVILEPVQNSGGCFTPPDGYFQRVREICDEYGIIFISDEVICAWGRLGEYFGSDRFGYEPDLITTAKGLTSSYAPMGAVIASDRVFEPFSRDKTTFLHGITFGDDECEWLLRSFLSPEIYKRGLICRADDRGDPVIQLAPPLIAGPEQFDEIRAALRPALEEASRRLDLR